MSINNFLTTPLLYAKVLPQQVTVSQRKEIWDSVSSQFSSIKHPCQSTTTGLNFIHSIGAEIWEDKNGYFLDFTHSSPPDQLYYRKICQDGELGYKHYYTQLVPVWHVGDELIVLDDGKLLPEGDGCKMHSITYGLWNKCCCFENRLWLQTMI